VWWLDGFCGLLVAFYTLYSGATTMMSSSVSMMFNLIDFSFFSIQKLFIFYQLQLSNLRSDTVSPTYINLMNRFRYSYQNDGNSSYALDETLKSTDRSILEIMQSEPTPYNSDEKDVLTQLLSAIYDSILNRLKYFLNTGMARSNQFPDAVYDRLISIDVTISTTHKISLLEFQIGMLIEKEKSFSLHNTAI